MYKLTPREALIFDAMMDDPEHVWTIEQLAKLCWEGQGKERPVSWRNGLINCMHILRVKTYGLRDNRVVKVSKDRGRGNVGKYALRKTALKNNMEVA